MGRYAETRWQLARAAAALVLAAGAFAQFRPANPQEKRESQEPPVFRSDVSLVRLLVTVKDLSGKTRADLARGDFRVFDNGVEQEIAVFDRQTEQPLSVAVLVDTSGSTAKDLRYEIESVRRFLKALLGSGNPEDASALYSFNWRVTLESSFTRRLSKLDAGLRQLHPEGGTSMYDAILFAARDLDERQGRKVVVMVTDGGDTTSSTTYHAALEAAQRADAIIYPILVMPITNDAGRNIGGENALETLARSTGGRVFAPSVGSSLDKAFEDILRDLRTQYLIGFYPRRVPLTANRFHNLRVDLKPAGLRAQTRSGYYGDAEEKGGSRQ